MSINPYTQKFEKAESQLNEISSKVEEITQEIDWYDDSSLEELNKHLRELRSSKEGYLLKLDRIRNETKKIESKLQSVYKDLKGKFNPLRYIKSHQRKIHTEAQKLEKSLSVNKEKESATKQTLNDYKSKIKNKKSEIKQYKCFDRDSKMTEKSMLTKKRKEKKKQVDRLKKRKEEIDAKIEPIVKQLNDAQHQKFKAQQVKKRASNYDDKLSRANNSYERAKIHEACEQEYGIGSPRKLISKKNSEIRCLKSDIQKLKKRAKKEAEKATRDIQNLIIDGNNLCYEGDEFIGLDALKVLIPNLVESYDITLIFDASIRSLLECNDSEIRELFDDDVDTHIVATSSKADETVLKLATDNQSFVISNDRFAEFKEKKPVNDKRIIRHEIVSGKIFIPDLSIFESYN